MRGRDRVHDREPDARDRGARPHGSATSAGRSTRPRPAGRRGRNPATSITRHVALRTRPELDHVARLRVLDRVLEQRVDRDPERVRVGAKRAARNVREPPRALGGLRPAEEDVLEEGLGVDLADLDEAPALRAREEDEALDDAVDARELVERDAPPSAPPRPPDRARSSRWPRAIVAGVRSSCERSYISRSWRRRSRSRSAASFSSAVAVWARRIASQPRPTRRTTMNHASYTSLIGSTPSRSSLPDRRDREQRAPKREGIARRDLPRRSERVVDPPRGARRTWIGAVSQPARKDERDDVDGDEREADETDPPSPEATRYPTLRTVSIGASGAEPPADAANAHVDDIRARVEAVAPDLGEQPLAAHRLAGVLDEVAEQPELAVGEHRPRCAEPRLARREVELEAAGADDARPRQRLDEVDADPREELVERERLLDVVACAELERAELRLNVAAGGDDDDRQLGLDGLDLLEDGEAVQLRQDEVEEDEVVAALARAACTASGPVRAHSTVIPSAVSPRVRNSAMRISSSTTRIRRFTATPSLSSPGIRAASFSTSLGADVRRES